MTKTREVCSSIFWIHDKDLRELQPFPAGLWALSCFRLCLVIIRHKEFKHECCFFPFLGISEMELARASAEVAHFSGAECWDCTGSEQKPQSPISIPPAQGQGYGGWDGRQGTASPDSFLYSKYMNFNAGHTQKHWNVSRQSLVVDSGNKGEQKWGGENLDGAFAVLLAECPWADTGQIGAAGVQTFQSDFWTSWAPPIITSLIKESIYSTGRSRGRNQRGAP